MNIDFIKNFKFTEQNIKICSIALVLVCVISILSVVGCAKNEKNDIVEIEDISITEPEKDTINVGNDGVNAGIAKDDDVTIVSQGKDVSNQTVAMTLEETGRTDPFLPSSSLYGINVQSSGYDLLPPPDVITTDETATEVMSTKVSGIMYDSINPSAILNISDNDYLVRAGDTVNGYKVLYITKDYVTVQYGANVYKAGVGEIIFGDGITENDVSNLNSKFGGNKR